MSGEVIENPGPEQCKSCIGTEYCRFGLGNSMGLAQQIEARFQGLDAPGKLKLATAGCPRNCSEALVKDVGAWKIEEESWTSAEAAALKEASCAELVAMIKDESKSSRFMEINALRGRECPEAVPVLAGLTTNFFQMTQTAAVEVLGSMGARAKSAVPALEAAAQAEKNPDVKAKMLEAIQQIGG